MPATMTIRNAKLSPIETASPSKSATAATPPTSVGSTSSMSAAGTPSSVSSDYYHRGHYAGGAAHHGGHSAHHDPLSARMEELALPKGYHQGCERKHEKLARGLLKARDAGPAQARPAEGRRVRTPAPADSEGSSLSTRDSGATVKPVREVPVVALSLLESGEVGPAAGSQAAQGESCRSSSSVNVAENAEAAPLAENAERRPLGLGEALAGLRRFLSSDELEGASEGSSEGEKKFPIAVQLEELEHLEEVQHAQLEQLQRLLSKSTSASSITASKGLGSPSEGGFAGLSRAGTEEGTRAVETEKESETSEKESETRVQVGRTAEVEDGTEAGGAAGLLPAVLGLPLRCLCAEDWAAREERPYDFLLQAAYCGVFFTMLGCSNTNASAFFTRQGWASQ